MRKGWLQCVIFVMVHLAFWSVSLDAQERQAIAPEETLKHHLQIRTVCGKIVGSRYATKIKGQPTLLHLGKPYPEHAFTIVIWGSDRGKFEKPPEELYRGKEVCVTGMIVEHRGKPQIVAYDPSQITVK